MNEHSDECTKFIKDCSPYFFLSVDICSSIFCLNNGSCLFSASTGYFNCTCPPGYLVAHCENEEKLCTYFMKISNVPLNKNMKRKSFPLTIDFLIFFLIHHYFSKPRLLTRILLSQMILVRRLLV